MKKRECEASNTYLGFISPCTVLIVRETHRDLYSHMVTIVVTGKAMDK
jgi:hypothetical protein